MEVGRLPYVLFICCYLLPLHSALPNSNRPLRSSLPRADSALPNSNRPLRSSLPRANRNLRIGPSNSNRPLRSPQQNGNPPSLSPADLRYSSTSKLHGYGSSLNVPADAHLTPALIRTFPLQTASQVAPNPNPNGDFVVIIPNENGVANSNALNQNHLVNVPFESNQDLSFAKSTPSHGQALGGALFPNQAQSPNQGVNQALFLNQPTNPLLSPNQGVNQALFLNQQTNPVLSPNQGVSLAAFGNQAVGQPLNIPVPERTNPSSALVHVIEPLPNVAPSTFLSNNFAKKSGFDDSEGNADVTRNDDTDGNDSGESDEVFSSVFFNIGNSKTSYDVKHNKPYGSKIITQHPPNRERTFVKSPAILPVVTKTIHRTPSYSYNYKVQNPKADHLSSSHESHESHEYSNFAHQETRRGSTTTGRYYVDLPDGRRQIVDYYADETGYHPTITYI